ncbi:MAG: hypothetical protein U9R38_02000 [Candidatus Margulisiibacteriota bacterium]|nr:hypothetical protein [Candidatus Margulisiibacteriota bacterium]
MEKIKYIIVLILLVFFVLPVSSADKKTYGKGYRFEKNGWVYVHIEGEPYERGFQHGYLEGYLKDRPSQPWTKFKAAVKMPDRKRSKR